MYVDYDLISAGLLGFTYVRMYIRRNVHMYVRTYLDPSIGLDCTYLHPQSTTLVSRATTTTVHFKNSGCMV